MDTLTAIGVILTAFAAIVTAIGVILSFLGKTCGKKKEDIDDAAFSYSVAPDALDAPSSGRVVPNAASFRRSVWILEKDLDIKHLRDHSREGKPYWIRTLHLGIFVPKLVEVWGLRIMARVNVAEINNHTRYTAFLVFDLRYSENLKRASAVTFGEEITEDIIEEITNSTEEQNFVFLDDGRSIFGQRGPHSRPRPDGWMEVKLGEVYNNLGDDSVLNICFWETDIKKRKSGLLVRGIELRPSNDP